MKARLCALPRAVPRRQWRFLSLVVVLVGSLLCPGPRAEAKSDYEIINTGIKGGGCWYDDSHFIVVKGHQPAPGQEFEVEGLYYLAPNKPRDLIRIELAPLEPALQRHIRDVTCQEQTILFYALVPDRKTSRLYSIKIGEPAELIAEFMRGGSANLGGGYVLSKFRRTSPIEEQGLRGVGIYEAYPDCGINHVKTGFRTLCVDTWMESGWSLPNFRLAYYTWYETVKVRDRNGHEKWITNPEPPLKRSDGTEIKLGFLLRDLDNRIVGEIPPQQGDYQYDTIHLKVDPSGQYLYCPCWKLGDHGGKRFTVGGRICRFRLDGQSQRWEEVVSVQQSPRDPYSLQDLDVNSQGDVVMIERGHRLRTTLWMYQARTGRVDKLLQVHFPDEMGRPQVSPSGRWVSVGRQGGDLVLLERKGDRP